MILVKKKSHSNGKPVTLPSVNKKGNLHIHPPSGGMLTFYGIFRKAGLNTKDVTSLMTRLLPGH